MNGSSREAPKRASEIEAPPWKVRRKISTCVHVRARAQCARRRTNKVRATTEKNEKGKDSDFERQQTIGGVAKARQQRPGKHLAETFTSSWPPSASQLHFPSDMSGKDPKMDAESCKIVASPSLMRESDEIIVDHIDVMLKKESISYYCPCLDYISVNMTSQATIEQVNESWRRKICLWSFELVDHFGFDREVVSIALNYLDRVIANTIKTTNSVVSRKEFQLVAVTTLYLAIKLHGERDADKGFPRKLRIEAFVELSRGVFSIENLVAKEREIFNALDWHVNPPTTVCFVASLLRFLPEYWDSNPSYPCVVSSIFEMARYLTELAVCVSSFSFQLKSSEISFAAILCAIDALRESVPLPYKARIAFLNRVAGATSLTPDTESIRKAGSMITELCPSLFTPPKVPESTITQKLLPSKVDPAEPLGSLSRGSSIASESGTSSPVSVNDLPEPVDASGHKRPRLF